MSWHLVYNTLVKPSLFVLATLSLWGCGQKPTDEATTGSVRKPSVSLPEPAPRKPSANRRFPLQSMERAKLSVKGKEIEAYVADDSAELEEGLMFVSADELGENQGMIFVFGIEGELSFWMKNTIIPLDVAFLKADGTIVNILTMRPLDESKYSSAGPVKYALEMNAHWFARNGVKAGDKVNLKGLR